MAANKKYNGQAMPQGVSNTSAVSTGTGGSGGAKTSNEMLDLILNRQPHSYNAETDPAAQAARKEAARNANASIRNTLGQHAGMTGGVASTAAVSAAAQAGSAALAQGADKVAELEQLSWQRYQQEGQNMADLYGMLRNQEQDALSNERYEREWQYQQSRDAVADKRYDQEWQYQQSRDQVADKRYDQEWAYQKEQDALANQRYDREWQYQVGRDQVADQRYLEERAYQQSRDQVADQRYNQEWQYQMGRDQVADQRYLEERTYQKEQDALANQRYDREWDYQVGRDQIEDQRYDQQWDYQREQDDYQRGWNEEERSYSRQQDAYEQELAMAQLMAAYGDLSGLKKLGINTSAYMTGGSGGSGGGSSGGSQGGGGSGGTSSGQGNDEGFNALLMSHPNMTMNDSDWAAAAAQYGEANLKAWGFKKKAKSSTGSNGNTGGAAQKEKPGQAGSNRMDMML